MENQINSLDDFKSAAEQYKMPTIKECLSKQEGDKYHERDLACLAEQEGFHLPLYGRLTNRYRREIENLIRDDHTRPLYDEGKFIKNEPLFEKAHIETKAKNPATVIFRLMHMAYGSSITGGTAKKKKLL